MKITRPSLGVLTVFAVLVSLLALSAPSSAVVSGANGRVVFVSDRAGANQVFSMRSDGTGVQELTSGTSNNSDPSYSGDGTKIAFISDRDGTPELYTMDASGANQTRVTTNSMVESHPSWAPNGSAIVFAGLTGTDSDIYTITPTGRGLTDLTPDPVAFDANPSWSPGGATIAFDSTNRNGDPGTNVWTMSKTGTQLKELTFTGKDSNPSWSPDNKTLAFESARDVVSPGPTHFAGLAKPNGVAVTANAVLVAQFSSDKVKSIDSGGVVSNFATLPTTGLHVERYLAISSGLGGFPAGDIYATVGQNIYQITPDGLTVTLFVNIPTFHNGEVGITFDTVGTFGYDMILTDRAGAVWKVDSSGVATFVGDAQHQIEGPTVAPLSFSTFGGQIILGNDFGNSVFAMDNTGTVSTVGSWTGSEGTILIPSTACNFGSSGGAYFVAMLDQNEILKFDASNFTGMGGDILVPSESQPDVVGIGRFHADGTISTFWAPVGTPQLEGSAFAPCPSKGLRTASVTATPAGPHEIYTMVAKDGSNQTRLTTNNTDDARPAWSPDGKSIVFQSDRDDPNQPTCEGSGTCLYDAYTMNAADGSSQTNISNAPTTNETSADWETVSYVQTVVDFAFSPLVAKPKLGGAVLWDFVGPSPHTATDNSGLALFDSGTVSAGGFFVYRFIGAGSYPIICTIHPLTMTGTVRVPMTAAPLIGNLTTIFKLTWAVALPPTGDQFDVQIFRPGAVDWADWRVNTTTKTGQFTADSGTGVYSFRARIQNVAQTLQTDYSAAVSITVNP